MGMKIVRLSRIGAIGGAGDTMEQIHERTITTQTGPNGQVEKSFSPPADEVKLWREEREAESGEEIEVPRIRVPVSSTGEDRDGDRFSEEGLEDMVRQYKTGEVPMYPNHGLDPETGFHEYRFEDKMGGWKDAEIVDEEGAKVVYAEAELSPQSEEADTLATQIENGVVPITFSVGFMPQNADTRTNEEGEPIGREFHEHDLFETSAVGIPANTDATVSAMAGVAAKGAAHAKGIEDPEAIEAMARDIAATVKAGGSYGEALKHMQKEPEEAIPLVESYLDADDTAPEDTLAEFLEWVESNDGDLSAANDAVEAFLGSEATSAEDPEEATVGDLGEWLVAEFGESDGDEEEGDDDEEGDEEEEQNSPEMLSAEQHREIVRDELEPIQNELAEIRSTLGEIRDLASAEEADGEDPEEEIEDLRSELAELRERLEEPRDPKGQRNQITRAERPGEENGGDPGTSSGAGADGGTIETTPRDGGNSRSNGDGDLDRLAEHLADTEN